MRDLVTTVTVRRMVGADVAGAATVLARSFHDDPAWQAVFPDPATRVQRHQRLLALTIPGMFLPGGESWVITRDGDVVGAALWMPLGHEPAPSKMLALLPRLAWTLGRRSIAVARLGAELERQRPASRHLYLAVLGIDPEHQGLGLGGQLLAPVLAHCDDDGMLAYLESSNPRNHGFYRRCGFTPTGEVTVTGWPTLWKMARPPRTAIRSASRDRRPA